MILSGPGALFGEPALKGAQMYVDELNAKVASSPQDRAAAARHQGQRRRGRARLAAS